MHFTILIYSNLEVKKRDNPIIDCDFYDYSITIILDYHKFLWCVRRNRGAFSTVIHQKYTLVKIEACLLSTIAYNQ